jgi:putative ABC transport system permease protein
MAGREDSDPRHPTACRQGGVKGSMREDLIAAFRSLRASKTFTAVALTVLALGIGASSAIFSVVDAVVLRGLPFDEHDRLVAIGEKLQATPAGGGNVDPEQLSSAAPQNYMDWAKQQTVFESIAAIAGGNFTLREPGAEPEELRAQRVTADFFKVLRVAPVRGRPFTAESEVEGRERVAVLSHGLWQRRFDADPAIVGKTIPIEGGVYEVIGVMGPEFMYPIGTLQPTDLWVPYVVPPDDRVRNPNNISIYLSTIARLKPGVSLEQARANLDQISAALTAAYPKWNNGTRAGIRPLRDHIVGARTEQWMLMLLGAVGIVLVIACANVANLMLARASSREREVGIRAALGASRWRIVRGLLVESLVLSVIGAAIALLLAWWGVELLRTSMPDGVPRIASIAVDLRVLAAAAGLALLTGLLVGIVPALQMSRPNLAQAMNDGARGASAGKARQHLRHALIVAEVALSVVLLVGAALFIGSFRSLMKIDPGFNPENVITAAIIPRLDRGISTGNSLPDYAPQVAQIVDELSRVPGVTSASAITGGMPMGGSMSITSVTVPGRKLEGRDGNISIRGVTPEYHAAIGIPLKHGRYLAATDAKSSTPVVILNEMAAQVLFPGESAVGKIIGLNGDRTVVGVVGNVYQSSLETEPRTEAYVPMTQRTTIFSELVVRTSVDPHSIIPSMKAAVLRAMPDVPLRRVRTLEEVLERRVAQRKLNMLLLGLFGLLGLVISAVGIYGVMAYLVSQRTREIGVRMALGASRARVVRSVIGRAATLIAIGLVMGGAGAWYLAATAQTFLFRMDVTDPRPFLAALVTLAAAGLLASVVPARRAASVSPMVALRADN